MTISRFLVLYLMVTPICGLTQKILLLETRRISPVKFYAGEEITFKLIDDPLWYTRLVYDLIPSSQSIVISNNRDTMHLPISSIAQMRNPYRGRGWLLPSRILMGSGAGLMITTLVYDVFRLGPGIKEDPIPLQVGAGQVVAGYTLKKLVADRKRVSLNQHRRLRIIDLTFYPAPANNQ